jgi:hypothetical protein
MNGGSEPRPGLRERLTRRATVVAVAATRRLPGVQAIRNRRAATWIPDKLRPLRLRVASDAPRRVNIVHPAIDLTHFFGGFITVFNLAQRLAGRGHRVRMITLEPSRLPADWRERIAAYEGLQGDSLTALETTSATDRSREVEVSPGDAFLATHWTAAHVAHAAAQRVAEAGGVSGGRFAYLIQEHEPFIFPMGSAAALAAQSYGLPHAAIFSTELLAEYFERHGIGVFAEGKEQGRHESVVFRNAITPVGPACAADLARAAPRRLLFYARPEPHAARNLFEIGVWALDEALAAGHFANWELIGTGTVRKGGWLTLPRSGTRLRMVPRGSQAEYARLLCSADAGLALMHTPHPSLPPIEMAAAGMATVTSVFENKTAAALAAISPNLIGAEPTVAGVTEGLVEAARRVEEFEARAAGSRVDWPSSWDEALDGETMARIESLLGL